MVAEAGLQPGKIVPDSRVILALFDGSAVFINCFFHVTVGVKDIPEHCMGLRTGWLLLNRPVEGRNGIRTVG